MRVSSISSTSNTVQHQNRTNFKGKWDSRQAIYMCNYPMYEIKNYIPDKGESYEETVAAWKKDLGFTPLEIAQQNNMYGRPQKGSTQYRYNDCPYLPVELLKASVDYSLKTDGYGQDKQIQSAWLDKQLGNEEGVKGNEKVLTEEFKKLCPDEKFRHIAAQPLDIYRSGFGQYLANNIDKL